MFYRYLASFLLTLIPFALSAQSGRVYDDQKMDVHKETHWYDTPFFWLGIIVFTLLLVYLIYRRRQRNPQNPLHS